MKENDLSKKNRGAKGIFSEDHFSSPIKFFIWICIIFFFIVWLAQEDGFCGEKSFQDAMSTPPLTSIKTVALLPLDNLSMSDSLPPDIIAMIHSQLIEKGKVTVLSSQRVEDFLIKERIRDTGSMSKATARQMGKKLRVDGIIMTYIDLLIPGDDPRVGIGCRMVSGHDGSLIWTGYESLSGSEFITWMGLGQIHSLDILVKKVVEKLFLTFPQKVDNIDNDIAPFEITEILVKPRNVRSSERVTVRLKLAYMGIIPYKMKAILESQERLFINERKQFYSCILYAPLREGKYSLRIEAIDRKNNISIFNAAAIINVDNTPPKVIIYFQDELFSPNRDKRKDTMIFFPYLKEPDTVRSWQLIIEDSDGEQIRKIEGRMALPRALVWRGENDFNSMMGDGKYYFRIRVEDKAGNATETLPKLLILDKTPPRTQIRLSALDNKGFRFHFDCEEKNGIDRWQLDILDSDRKIIQFYEGEGLVPPSLEWKTGSSDIDNMSYSFEVKDLAGNIGVVGPRSVKRAFTSQEFPIPEREEKKKEWNYDF